MWKQEQAQEKESAVNKVKKGKETQGKPRVTFRCPYSTKTHLKEQMPLAEDFDGCSLETASLWKVINDVDYKSYHKRRKGSGSRSQMAPFKEQEGESA